MLILIIFPLPLPSSCRMAPYFFKIVTADAASAAANDATGSASSKVDAANKKIAALEDKIAKGYRIHILACASFLFSGSDEKTIAELKRSLEKAESELSTKTSALAEALSKSDSCAKDLAQAKNSSADAGDLSSKVDELQSTNANLKKSLDEANAAAASKYTEFAKEISDLKAQLDAGQFLPFGHFRCLKSVCRCEDYWWPESGSCNCPRCRFLQFRFFGRSCEEVGGCRKEPVRLYQGSPVGTERVRQHFPGIRNVQVEIFCSGEGQYRSQETAGRRQHSCGGEILGLHQADQWSESSTGCWLFGLFSQFY